MKTISVIIPAYNPGRYLRAAIDSVLGQTYPALEVIVVDDGSTDSTPQTLAGYGDRLRVLRQTNQGVAAARNAGMAAAAGEYLAFLDADDLWTPRKLELQIARFEADPDLGLVHGGTDTFDDTGKTLHRSRSEMEGWVAEEILRLDHEVIGAPSSNIMVPKAVVEEIGGFDPQLPPSEDWDFCYRVAVRHRVGYVGEVLARYRQHGGGIHLNIPNLERSMLRTAAKAFVTCDPAVQSLRNHTYGRIHCILAGCYFQARQARPFARHMVKSLRYDPRNLRHFAAYPLRVMSRALGGSP